MFGISRAPSPRNLSPAEVRDLIASDAVTLVDVREVHEWERVRIPGAVHAPLSRFVECAPNLPTGRPLVFYCVAGGRSAQAVALSRSIGLKHDAHLAGGINAWCAKGYPVSN